MSNSCIALVFVLLVFLFEQISANELTFELPDNAKECFHEQLKVGSKFVLEFQVEEREKKKRIESIEKRIRHVLGGDWWKLRC